MNALKTFQSKYAPGDKVIIDGDKSITATITTVMFGRGDRILYQCEWFSNGGLQNPYIEDWRVTIAEAA